MHEKIYRGGSAMKNKNVIIIIAIIGIVLIMFASTYNHLAKMDENINGRWAQVKNVLKRRADLIPNLVSTVKGYAQHESEVLLGITEARSEFESAQTPEEYAQANEQLNTSLTKLYAVAENYPELKEIGRAHV